MSFVDNINANMAQAQSALASASNGPGEGFDQVMAQVAALSSLGSAPPSPTSLGATASAGAAADLSGNYGWPVEEGTTLSGSELAQLDDAAQQGPGETGPASSAAALSSSGSAFGSSPLAGSAGQQPASPSGDAIVADARKYLGVPYVWGGTNPAQGVDCSGLVQDVFKDEGVNLPRVADQQAKVGTPVPDLADAQPGDLLFFAGSDGTAADPGHVGIYIGNGQMIDAPHTGTAVQVQDVPSAGPVTAIRRVGASGSSFEAPATSGTGLGGTPYANEFAQASAKYGVPEQLLSAVAATESNYDPQAVSQVGAQGLMQLMPSTASSLGVDPFSPAQAIDGGAKLLAGYKQQFGSWSLALAAYNAGPGTVGHYGGVPPYSQTQNYVENVLNRADMEGQ